MNEVDKQTIMGIGKRLMVKYATLKEQEGLVLGNANVEKMNGIFEFLVQILGEQYLIENGFEFIEKGDDSE